MSSQTSEQEIQQILLNTETRMVKSLESLKHNVNSLRTGRASPSLLDTVKVESYGTLVPINQVANISVPEARLIVVQVWDKNLLKAVEKAIRDSDLGLNPSSEGVVVRVPIPDLTEERRKEMVKKGAEYCENAKIAIRSIRREVMDMFKKMEKDKKISEDLMKHYSEKVQKTTDVHTKKADDIFDVKSKEIMKV